MILHPRIRLAGIVRRAGNGSSRVRSCAVVGLALFGLCLVAEQARADYVYMNAVYSFYDSGLGRAFVGRPWEVPNGHPNVVGPYGGNWNGQVGPPSSGYWSHPWDYFGYPVHYSVADIPAYIFQTEPGVGVFQPDPPPGTVSFLSLPGDVDAGNFSYVTVGYAGRLIDPNGPGNDIKIEAVFDSSDVAWIYASNRIVADPSTLGPADWTFVGVAFGGLETEFDLAAVAGITDLVQAIKIEGRDLNGESAGFDLAGVFVAQSSLVDLNFVPEPGAVVLLAIGACGVLAAGWRRIRARGR